MTRAGLLLTVGLLLAAMTSPALAHDDHNDGEAAQHGAIRFSEDATGVVFSCASGTYTVTSGKIRVVARMTESASGPTSWHVTVTLLKVVAEDAAGNVYRIVGANGFGETVNAETGGWQATLAATQQIIGQGGGKADSVRVSAHVTVQPNNVVEFWFDFGSCDLPDA